MHAEMNGLGRGVGVTILAAILSIRAAHADLYSANAAYDEKDFEHAFESYREIAELGHPMAQEALAVMYVNGQGVKRDNVLGYAWASAALSNGGGEVSHNIIDQLEPHMTPAARERVREITARFGQDALRETLLEKPDPDGKADMELGCTFKRPANPDDYYPLSAIRSQKSGVVMIDMMVMPDGRSHNPQVVYAYPDNTFDESARRVAQETTFNFLSADRSKPCRLRSKIKFTIPGSNTDSAFRAELAKVQKAAEQGDPQAQMLYGFMAFARPDLIPPSQKVAEFDLLAAQAGLPVAQYSFGVMLIMNSQPQKRASGIRWLKIAANNGSPEAKVVLALESLLGAEGAPDIPTAQSLLEQASATGKSISAKFYLAAMLAAGPQGAHIDGKRARELLEAVEREMPSNPTVFEIGAAACATEGAFDDAQKLQQKALSMARRLGWDTAPQQQRLDTYVRKQEWRGNFFAP